METMKEHNEHCKKIADTLFEVWNNKTYKCPHCGWYIVDDREFDEEGLVINVDNEHDESGAMMCSCGEWVQFDDWNADNYAEEVTIGQYLFDDCFDIKVTRSGFDPRGDVTGVRVMVAVGGPNIYVDTNDCMVELHWWGEHGEWPLNGEVAQAIDEYAQELSECY